LPKEIAGDLARLIDLGQRQARQWHTGRRPRDWNFRFGVVPAPQQFTPELFIRACALDLIENERVVVLSGLTDLSARAHRCGPYIPVIPSGVEESLIISPPWKYQEMSRLRST